MADADPELTTKKDNINAVKDYSLSSRPRNRFVIPVTILVFVSLILAL